MRINYNLSAMLTNTQLLRNERNQQSAAERLASGLKINHAKDDPAGMAISNKMDVQIEGIRQASRNSSDGISIIETADSSLNEVTTIIQRMRELAVQAASDTNCLEDREAIQEEIDSLSAEIDRVSTNTEFNKKVLLDGSLSRRTYTDNRKVSVTNASEGVPADKYGVTITADARQAVFKGALDYHGHRGTAISSEHDVRVKELSDAFSDGKLRSEAAGKVTINGQIIEFEAGDTLQVIYQKLREGAEIVDVTCIASVEGYEAIVDEVLGGAMFPDFSGKNEETAGYTPNPEGWNGENPLVFISKDYGSDERIEISCDNALLAAGLGLAQRGFAFGGVYEHRVSANGTSTTSAEIKCYRSTDIYLVDMPNPPLVLDRNNKAHEKYFEDPAVAGMEIPALYNGGFIDLAEKDADGNLVNQKYMTFYDKIDAIPDDPELKGKIKITNHSLITSGTNTNYRDVNIEVGDTAAQVFKKIQTACSELNMDVYLTDDVRKENYSILDEDYNYSQALVFKDKDVGGSISIACDNARLSQMLGLPVCEWTATGKDCQAEFADGDSEKAGTQRIGFSDSASITTKGNKITVTDKNGFELELEAEKKTCNTFYADYSASGRIGRDRTMKSGDESGNYEFETVYSNYDEKIYIEYGGDIDVIADVTGYGMMTVHTGANENQIIDVDIPKVNCKTLGIDGLNVRSGWTADKALAKLDAALTKVSAVRSKLGAYQNRMESTVNSLNANDEDLTAAVSRIRDVDMAAETTEYTQHTILVQAATSVLAQANELPQQALQLIQ
ncbi:MAG: flagellin [Lachnospiraceae bacterium]|nr:flagellin [Lachnospiraceae bacterium]